MISNRNNKWLSNWIDIIQLLFSLINIEIVEKNQLFKYVSSLIISSLKNAITWSRQIKSWFIILN